ncbi:hypothetical protein BBJ28_00006983 [Nothophytophthora sp. Chile5]|nr:hypothetical protein BBJ28_00006983 [Nothophytophthora sp. Chile5]
MAEDAALLAAVTGFLHDADTDTDGLQLEAVDGQLLLEDTDALLQSLDDDKQAVRHAKAGERRDAYRRRRKDERQALLHQEAQLSEELQALRKAQSDLETPEDDTGNIMTSSAWKVIAMRQKERRLLAETQQRRLQAAVSSQAVLIQDLERVLSKRLRRERLSDSASMHPEKRARLEPSDDMLFEAYLGELDAVYRRTDSIFRTCGTPLTPAAVKSFSPVRKQEGDTEFYENVDLLRVPLDFQQTCAAIWELAAVPHRQVDRQHYDKVKDPKNVSAVKFRVRCPREAGEDATLVTHFVARRYDEEARMIVVWRGLSEAEGEFNGINSDEVGWSVAYPTPSDSDSGFPSTMVQTCSRIVPLHFSGCQRRLGQFTELLLRSCQEIDLEIAERMEGLNLDDAAAREIAHTGGSGRALQTEVLE